MREILLLTCILLLDPSGLYLLHDSTRQYLKWDNLLSRAQGTCLSVENWRHVAWSLWSLLWRDAMNIYDCFMLFWGSLFYVGLVYRISVNDEK